MKKDIKIFLFIDALGYKTVVEKNFLQSILPYRKKITMQFGYSSSAMPTILSGVKPAEHGHLGLFRYDPIKSPFKWLGVLGKFLYPSSFWKRGRVRHILSKIVKRCLGFTGYFQLYQMDFKRIHFMDYAEPKDIFAEKGMHPYPNLYDLLKESQLKFHISDWRKSAVENIQIGKELVKNATCDFLFLYVADFDALEHDHVEDWAVLTPMLNRYEKEVQEIIAEAKKNYKNCSFTIFSDHGMTPLTQSINPKDAIEKSSLIFGKDYGACYNSTMLQVTYFNEHAKKTIRGILQEFSSNLQRLSLEEEKKYGIYRQDRYFGDEIYLAGVGVQIVPSDLTDQTFNGMHGYSPEDQYSDAAILSTDEIPDYVHCVADYYQLMQQSIKELEEEL